MKKYFKRNNGSEAIIEIVDIHESGDYLCNWFGSEGTPFRYNKWDFDKEFIKIEQLDIDKLERQLCPEHYQLPSVFTKSIDDKSSKPDYWKTLSNGDRVCSYCGSLHPDDVLKIVKEFGSSVIGKTDKSYKWYINRPNVTNALEGGIKYYRCYDTQEFIDELNTLISK